LFKQRAERFKERFLIKSGEDLSFVRTSEISRSAYFRLAEMQMPVEEQHSLHFVK
jgi:hypothetical protein